MKKEKDEFETFDDTMRGLLSVPYSELQKKLEEKQAKATHKKKQPTLTASSRASSSRKKRVR